MGQLSIARPLGSDSFDFPPQVDKIAAAAPAIVMLHTSFSSRNKGGGKLFNLSSVELFLTNCKNLSRAHNLTAKDAEGGSF